MSDGSTMMIIFGLLIVMLIVVIIVILLAEKYNRTKEEDQYLDVVQGEVKKIKHRGLDDPDVICVNYCVDDTEYYIQEMLNLKNEVIEAEDIPV